MERVLKNLLDEMSHYEVCTDKKILNLICTCEEGIDYSYFLKKITTVTSEELHTY